MSITRNLHKQFIPCFYIFLAACQASETFPNRVCWHLRAHTCLCVSYFCRTYEARSLSSPACHPLKTAHSNQRIPCPGWATDRIKPQVRWLLNTQRHGCIPFSVILPSQWVGPSCSGFFVTEDDWQPCATRWRRFSTQNELRTQRDNVIHN